MVSIESQVTSEKKWDLSFLMEMLTEAQEMNDDTQVRIIAKRALEQAKKQGNEQWEGKFQAILDKYSSNVKFDETSYKESKTLEVTTDQKHKEHSAVKNTPKPRLKNKVNSSGPKLTEWAVKNLKAFLPTPNKSFERKEESQVREDLYEKHKIDPQDEVEAQVSKIDLQVEDLKDKCLEMEISPTIEEEMEEVLSTKNLHEEFKEDVIIPQKNLFIEVDAPPLKTAIIPSKKIITDIKAEREQSQSHSESLGQDFSPRSRIPYREQRIKTLPNAEQLLQRQQSAQKILAVIREAGMIEIPMNKPELSEIFRAVDLLACKAMRGENGRCIILLVPIKHVITTDPVYVWDSHVMTGQINGDPTTAQNMAIDTHTKKLLQASEYLFSDMISGRSLISLVARYIGILMKTNLTIKNQRLYLGSGEIEYQIIIDPVLLCDTHIYCMEKTLPYAYQQGSNLHVVSQKQLEELLEYLEVKYRLLIRHDTSQNAIMKVKDAKLSTFKQFQLFSLPFIAYGVLFSFFLILGFQEAVRFCISLGCGLIFVYGGFIGYSLYHHFKALKNVGTEFSVPFHQKPLNLAEEDYILINDQLSPEWMTQFSHEVENHQNISYQKRIKHNALRAKSPTASFSPNKEKEIPQAYPNEQQPNNNYPVNNKYQAFLDD